MKRSFFLKTALYLGVILLLFLITISFNTLRVVTVNGTKTIRVAQDRFKLDDLELQIKETINENQKNHPFPQRKIQKLDEYFLRFEQRLEGKKLPALEFIKQKWDRLKDQSSPDPTEILHDLDLLHRAVTKNALDDITKREAITEKDIPHLKVMKIVIGVLIFTMLVFAMYLDTLQSKQKEELLKQLHESEIKTIESLKAKAIFLAIAGHGLRTPLKKIIGLSELLIKKNLPEEETKFIHNIYHSGKTLLKKVNNVLEFDQIESGKIELENSEFSLSTVLLQIIITLSAKAQEKNINLHYVVDNDVPKKIMGDASRLSQIIYNLLENAIKFTDTGSVILGVNVQSLNPDEGLCLNFSVKAASNGLTPAQLEKDFFPYDILSTSGTNDETGSDLGLAISMQLIHALGGELQVTSELNKGSCISFTAIFPKYSAEKIGAIEQHDLLAEIFDKENPPTILVADDNPTNLLMLQEMLERLGANTISATNGKEAIYEYSNSKIDLILMDCQMPVMDGFEASRELRKLTATNTPIIAMTSNLAATDLKKCFESGMNGFIEKPISLDLLIKEISKVVTTKTAIDSPQLIAPQAELPKKEFQDSLS